MMAHTSINIVFQFICFKQFLIKKKVSYEVTISSSEVNIHLSALTSCTDYQISAISISSTPTELTVFLNHALKRVQSILFSNIKAAVLR